MKATFGSKYAGYMLVIEPGGPKYTEKHGFIPKVPFKGVTFNDGIFSTEDEELAEVLRTHPQYGTDYWEVTKPEDASRVNIGRKLEVSQSVSSTSTAGPQTKK